jgi:hypothetical protein
MSCIRAVKACGDEAAIRSQQRDVLRQIELRHVSPDDSEIKGRGAGQGIVPRMDHAALIEYRDGAAIASLDAGCVHLCASLYQQAIAPNERRPSGGHVFQPDDIALRRRV